MNYCIEIDGSIFYCPSDTTVLLAMLNKGKEYLPVGCCAGGCGICKIKVLQGEYEVKVMSRAQVTVTEQAQGLALACRVLPKSDLKIEKIK